MPAHSWLSFLSWPPFMCFLDRGCNWQLMSWWAWVWPDCFTSTFPSLSDHADHWDSDFYLKRTCCDPCHCINHITAWECEHDWFNLIPQNTLEKGFILAILENKPIYYSCPSLIVITVTHSWLQKPLMWAHKHANTITTPKNPRLSPPSMDLIISESCKTLPQSEAKKKKKKTVYFTSSSSQHVAELSDFQLDHVCFGTGSIV